MKVSGYEAPSWTQIYHMLQCQASIILRSGFQPDIILGVCRGGWIPARILSDLLSNPNLASIKAECYKFRGEPTDQPVITQCLSAEVKGKTVLVVDEVADSGRTLKLVAEHVKERGARDVKTATLYCKPCSIFKPNYFEKKTACWIVFPWDVREAVKTIYEKHKADPEGLKNATENLADAGISNRLIERLLKEFKKVREC